MLKHDTPGKLITFCGLDGCGKTTLITMLSEYLTEQGYDVLLTKQPTEEFRRSNIFRSVQDTPDHIGYDYRAMSLMAAGDRLQHCFNTILPALEQGSIVISDRYFYSCLANLKARGYIQDKWIYEILSHAVKPDLAFFLNIDVETALKRVRSRIDERDTYINIELQYRLKSEYEIIAGQYDGITINTAQSISDCFDAVLKHFHNICSSAVA